MPNISNQRFMLRSAVFLILIKDDKILLSRRKNSGWKDGQYNLIAGHLDGGETIKSAMIREANEETGITINENDIDVVHTMHRISSDLLCD